MSAVNETATPRDEIVSLLRLALHSWQRLKATRWSTSSPCWRRDAHVYALGDVVSAQNVLNCWSQVKPDSLEDNVALLEHHLRRSRLPPPVIAS